MLSHLQDYEAILSIQKTEGPARGLIFPPSEKNLDIWYVLIHAAVETGETNFAEQYMPAILEVCSEQDEFDFLMCLLSAYQEEHQREKLAAIKQRLRFLMPKASFNKYFEENIRKQIEE